MLDSLPDGDLIEQITAAYDPDFVIGHNDDLSRGGSYGQIKSFKRGKEGRNPVYRITLRGDSYAVEQIKTRARRAEITQYGDNIQGWAGPVKQLKGGNVSVVLYPDELPEAKALANAAFKAA